MLAWTEPEREAQGEGRIRALISARQKPSPKLLFGRPMTSQATKHKQRPCKSYPCLMPVRASPREKASIETRARQCRLSASRFLVRLATREGAPPTEEEREALRDLGVLLEGVGANLRRIAHRTNQAWMYGETPQQGAEQERELEAVVKGVKLLTGQIRKRLGRR